MTFTTTQLSRFDKLVEATLDPNGQRRIRARRILDKFLTIVERKTRDEMQMKFGRLSDINDEPEKQVLHDFVYQEPWSETEFRAELEAILRQHFGAYASPSKVEAAIVDIEELRRKHGGGK